jgi:Transposase DDE domain
MTSWTMPVGLSTWIGRWTPYVDRRLQPVLAAVFVGIFCTAERRRTATSWFRAAGIDHDFRRGYRAIRALGRKVATLATQVLCDVERSPAAAHDERIVIALDDTPTQRYGPHVEGAGLHHNPAPGPSGAPLLYGHSWVTAARLVSHPQHGTIALPLRAELYVRNQDVRRIPKERRRPFRTKLQQAAGLLEWLGIWLGNKGKALWLAVDGGYAKKPVLQAAQAHGFTVVSRLRQDAALRDLPGPRSPGQRGRPAIYGRAKIRLAKRAGHKHGWQTQEMVLYGKKVTKTYKTFLATWRPAGGVIRVVLVKESDGWRAFFCTQAEASVAEILGLVAQRGAIEQTFKDVKEVWGAGQQQLRNLQANIGAWHLNLWAHTLVELWAWSKPATELVDRSASPWDSAPRRPSHADRRKALLRQSLQEEYQAALCGPGQKQKLQRLALRLLERAA